MPRYFVCGAIALSLWIPGLLTAQVEVGSAAWRTLAADGGTTLLLEHRFAGGSADSGLVRLTKDGYYWLELSGSSARPVVRRADRDWQAFVAPVDAPGRDGAILFEVHPASSGLHVVTVPDAPADSAALLRLYSHDGEAALQRVLDDNDWSIGLALQSGWHSGYRLASSTSAAPGGSDLEGSLLIESGRGLGVDLGISRHSLPGAGYAVTWYFLQPRVRLLDRKLIGTSATELWALGRLGQARSTPVHGIDPNLLGAGLRIRQYLKGAGRHQGWAVSLGYFHGRIGGGPLETSPQIHLVSAGLSWVP